MRPTKKPTESPLEKWLQSVTLERYHHGFLDLGIATPSELMELTEPDLKDIGTTLGMNVLTRRKFIQNVKAMCARQDRRHRNRSGSSPSVFAERDYTTAAAANYAAYGTPDSRPFRSSSRHSHGRRVTSSPASSTTSSEATYSTRRDMMEIATPSSGDSPMHYTPRERMGSPSSSSSRGMRSRAVNSSRAGTSTDLMLMIGPSERRAIRELRHKIEKLDRCKDRVAREMQLLRTNAEECRSDVRRWFDTFEQAMQARKRMVMEDVDAELAQRCNMLERQLTELEGYRKSCQVAQIQALEMISNTEVAKRSSLQATVDDALERCSPQTRLRSRADMRMVFRDPHFEYADDPALACIESASNLPATARGEILVPVHSPHSAEPQTGEPSPHGHGHGHGEDEFVDDVDVHRSSRRQHERFVNPPSVTVEDTFEDAFEDTFEDDAPITGSGEENDHDSVQTQPRSQPHTPDWRSTATAEDRDSSVPVGESTLYFPDGVEQEPPRRGESRRHSPPSSGRPTPPRTRSQPSTPPRTSATPPAAVTGGSSGSRAGPSSSPSPGLAPAEAENPDESPEDRRRRERAARHHSEGKHLRRAGQYEDAEIEFKLAIHMAPHEIVYRRDFVNMLNVLGRHKEAVEQSKEIFIVDPNCTLEAVHNNYGVALKNLKRYDEAEEHYRKEITAHPDNQSARHNYAILLKSMKRFKAAADQYKCALQAQPDFPQCHKNYADLLRVLKHYELASKHYNEAIRLDPDNPSTLKNYGLLLKKMRKFEDAERVYMRALELHPDSAKCHSNFGDLLEAMRKFDQAEKHYKEAIRLDPHFAAVRNNYGFLLKKMKRYEEAEVQYRRALEINPEYETCHGNFAMLLRKVGRRREAIFHEKKSGLPAKRYSVA